MSTKDRLMTIIEELETLTEENQELKYQLNQLVSICTIAMEAKTKLPCLDRAISEAKGVLEGLKNE